MRAGRLALEEAAEEGGLQCKEMVDALSVLAVAAAAEVAELLVTLAAQEIQDLMQTRLLLIV